ncbi:MAG: transposase [Planctomycetes bacterium]|nr:transposase [Planctomycetota bacterium]
MAIVSQRRAEPGSRRVDGQQAVIEVEPGEAPPGSIAVATQARRRFTASERLELVEGCRRSGVRVELYAEARGLSDSALRKWLAAYASYRSECPSCGRRWKK